ncbi:MAG: hypothetical protein GW893_13275 [Armatimonadetes bacterium]|nr:hypothetical protein [Armatimonadota bacterium]
MSRSRAVRMSPLTGAPLATVVEGGEVSAVIVPVQVFDVWDKLMKTAQDEDAREAEQLARIPRFQAGVREGLESIEKGETRPWREALADA